MNYRHIYHAGNFADVFKHIVLIMLVQALTKKDKAILFMDTHAGIGKYDLTTEMAQKTNEYTQGFLKLYQKNYHPDNDPAVIASYKNLINALNLGQEIPTLYPGSPWIIKALMRPQDQLILTELHPEDILTLKRNFAHNKQIAIHHLSGYAALKAFLPPKCGRGLVLIDPPFEDKNEFGQILASLDGALKRFKNGIYLIWYPIKDRGQVEQFYQQLGRLEVKNWLMREFGLMSEQPMSGLSKCGIAILNPPWQFEHELDQMIAWLKNTFYE